MELLTELNEEQQTAVTTLDGPLLVLAGAGSGKTRVVTCRIAHLIQEGIHPSKILGLTFTNKAAQEMKERIMNISRHRVLISTFHSLGARILRESIDALGYSPSFTIYDDQDTDKLVKACLHDIYPEQKKLEVKPFKAMISRAKNALLTPDRIDRSNLRTNNETLFPKVYQTYQERLEAYQALDFDDLLFLTVRLFQEHPDVLEMYQNRWSHLLVDEYQDTNVAQYTMITHLVEKSGNICVVGDPDQSIYSWRGANIHNILNFERDNPGTKVIRLERNYRSHETILQASNALISHNTDRYEKELWSECGPGEKVKCFEALDEREEAQYIAEQIRYHHDYDGTPLNQMVVFYRTNAQSRVFEDELLFQKIPYIIVGGISFYQRKEIKDILAFLRMVHSGADAVSFARTVNLPKRGIGETTIEKIRLAAERAQQPILAFCQSLIDSPSSLRLSSKHLKGLQDYCTIINDMRKMQDSNAPISDLVQTAIDATHYLSHLSDDPETFNDRKENLDALVSKAMEWEDTHETPTLSSFLEELSLKSTLDEVKDDQDCINLMTIHNGKGLEFDVTFIAGLEEDLFPHVNSRSSQEALEEERRLCYVGMTRARKFLYLVHSQMRFMWGIQRTQRQSRFLKEIPHKFKELIY